MMHNKEREVHVDFFFVLGFPFDSTFGPSTKEMEENVVEK